MVKKLTVKIYDLQGESTKDLDLVPAISSVKINKSLLTQSIQVYLTNQRQGTVATKTRSEVIGSTRKIYRQKGTGRARHSSLKAPIFVGGGVAHGPHPKNYHLKFNKKQRQQALAQALNVQANENNILVLADDLLKIDPKTKILFQLLGKLKIENQKLLFVLEKIEDNNFTKAARNLNNVKLIDVNSLNVYQLLSYGKIIFTEKALTILQSKIK